MCGKKCNRTATNLLLILGADERADNAAYHGTIVFCVWVDSWCNAIKIRQLSLDHLSSLFIQPLCSVLHRWHASARHVKTKPSNVLHCGSESQHKA